MKITLTTVAAALGPASVLTLHAAPAQLSGTHRTDLQQHDLSIPGREVVQAHVDVDPGKSVPKHRHPGEEIVYVLEGQLEYQLEGKPTVTLKAGDVLFIPAGVAHTEKNIPEFEEDDDYDVDLAERESIPVVDRNHDLMDGL